MGTGMFKTLFLGFLVDKLFGGMTRHEKRNTVRNTMRKNRSKRIYKPVKGMPKIGEKVIAITKYGHQERKCEYRHRRFYPLHGLYSFSMNEIVEWRKLA
jgi:hypothetical protein